MTQQLEMDFFKNDQEQVRLKEITVFNWGSFNGLHTMHINPEGTLITGENGSGKSTIIDGLMTLLRPAGKVDYNLAAAQDQKKDRSLVSYMRGSFGSMVTDDGQVSRNLRENSVVSVVSAVYEFSASLTQTALLGVFFINGTSNAYADVHKIYAIANSPFNIRELLTKFKDFDTRKLKNYLKSIDHCNVCDDNFGEYETHFRHQLRMDNKNAPALLSRALGLKKIDDLTSLIRTLVLEPGSVRQEAQNTIRQFDDLKAVHEQLVDARKQEEALSKLPQAGERLENTKVKIEEFTSADRYAESYINRFAKSFYEQKLAELEIELKTLASQLDVENVRHSEAKNYSTECHTALIQGGGSEPERLKLEIENCKRSLVETERNYSHVSRLLANLNLPPIKSADDFLATQKAIQNLKAELEEKRQANEKQHYSLGIEHEKTQIEANKIQDELKDLSRRKDSNLPSEFQKLRRSIAEDLGIDTGRLVYIAELIEVKEQEKSWQGAIERALGGLRPTLLVSKDECPLITKWVNSHFTGLHVRVQAVDLGGNVPKVEFGNQGFLVKLKFKDHLYSNWLKQHLNKFDLYCASSVEELNSIEFSMTREGLIHKNRGFYEKKDRSRIDDRMQWYTGFSNADKLKLLAEQEQNLRLKLKELEHSLTLITQAGTKLRSMNDAIVSLSGISSYSTIDTESLKNKINDLNNKYNEAISSPTIAQLQANYDKSLKEVERINRLIMEINGNIRLKENDQKLTSQKLNLIANQEGQEIPEGTVKLLDTIIRGLKLTAQNVFLDQGRFEVHQRINAGINKFSEERNTASTAVVRIISSFYNTWKGICVDWGTDIESYPSYLGHLEKIRADGLPKLVEDFKNKLNRDVTQSIVTIDQSIKQELSSIRDRISLINGVLKKAEFSENTYLNIEAKPVVNPMLTTFAKNTRRVMSSVNESDPELRYKYILLVINNLTEALNSGAMEYRTILDPRLRMQFLANVIAKDTGEIKDTLNSSSGKSGGEKESFAGCVLAASLAYVLTPENGDRPIYATVFLDEAFSNTSDKVSKRVLKIFKELNLHVNLITPFKNIELARDYARSLVIMEKAPGAHSSTMCELTWKEYDNQLDARQELELAALGVKVEGVTSSPGSRDAENTLNEADAPLLQGAHDASTSQEAVFSLETQEEFTLDSSR